MSIVRIDDVGGNSLDRATKLLAGIAGGAEKAVRSAMGRATDHIRANSSRKIREVYAISDSAIRANQNVTTKYSYHAGSGLTAEVRFAGSKIPLYRYSGTYPVSPTTDASRKVNVLLNGWVQVHPAVAATGHQLKSTSPTRFENAFVARFGSGHTGIYERTGGATSTGRDQIRELMGSSVPQMLGNEDVEEALAYAGMQKFEERLDHEIYRILNGWGG